MEIDVSTAYDELSKRLKANRLSVFAGSGISVDSGLPAWDGFIEKYIEMCEKLNDRLHDEDKFTEIIDDAKKHKDKDLIGTITALKDKVTEIKRKSYSTDFVDDKLNKLFYSATYNDYHKFIVSTNYRQIITTNYDPLLEDAAEDLGYNDLLMRSYSYTAQQSISSTLYAEKTAIIHAHGKAADLKLDEFVLTKDDYLKIMKHNTGFRTIINTIFVTSSVLFVGYGGSDPHFEDIISDLNYTLGWNQDTVMDLPKCYILLRADKVTPIRKFLNDKHRVDIISCKDYGEMKELLKRLSLDYPRAK